MKWTGFWMCAGISDRISSACLGSGERWSTACSVGLLESRGISEFSGFGDDSVFWLNINRYAKIDEIPLKIKCILFLLKLPLNVWLSVARCDKLDF